MRWLMKKAYPLLFAGAWLLERALPAEVYVPIYRWIRGVYDVRVLGLPPSGVCRPRYVVPVQEVEEFEAVESLKVETFSADDTAFAEDKKREPEPSRSITPPLQEFIQCDGSVIDRDLPPEDPAKYRVADTFKGHGVQCEIVLCCSFLGRHSVLEQVITESLTGKHAGGIRWMLTGSTDEDLEFIRSMADRTGQVAGFVCENKPLGRKWQTCIQHALHYFDAELYTVNGSDDILSRQLLDFIVERHSANRAKSDTFTPSLYCTNEWLVYSSVGRYQPMLLKCGYKYDTAFQPVGSGRFYTRSFLDSVQGVIFDSRQQRTLDAYGFFKVWDTGGQVEYYSVEDGPFISVKGEWEQLNSLDAFFQVPTLSINEFAFEGYPLLREALHPETFEQLFQPNRRSSGLFG